MATIREVQLFSLEILKEVVRVCEQNNLTYYLNGGTLLGAVRHQGFIPWDNDVDIEMPVEDYKRFLKIAPKELPDKFFVQTYMSDSGYNEMWAKVRCNGTTSLPVAWKNYQIHFGIGIDIFPLVGLYKNNFMRKLQTKLLGINRAMLSKEFALATQPELKHNFKTKLLYLLPHPFRCLICKMNELIIFKKFYISDMASSVWFTLPDEIEVKAYGEGVSLPFEDVMLLCPSDWDTVLTTVFGDYMTPPPVEERNGHEGSLGKIIYDCDRDYSFYQS